MRVLIVDESKLIRDWLRNLLLSIDGLEIVGVCADVRYALSAVREMRPQMLVIDIGPNVREGLDLMRSIKKEPDAPLVIVFTNRPSDPYRAHCAEMGVDYFFDKAAENLELIMTFKQLARKIGKA